MKKYAITLTAVLGLILFVSQYITPGNTVLALEPESAAAEVDTDSTKKDTNDNKEDTKAVTLLKYWNDCKGFRWALGGVFFLGLLLAFVNFLTNRRDRSREIKIQSSIEEGSDRTALDGILTRFKDNSYSVLVRGVIKARELKLTEKIDALAETYRANEQFRMDNFKRWMMYFSSASGALGLLGTVHGITSTFSLGSAFNQQDALSGMGIALSTTFVGLVISLVLDFIASWIHQEKDRKLQENLARVEELRFHDFTLQTGRTEQVS